MVEERQGHLQESTEDVARLNSALGKGGGEGRGKSRRTRCSSQEGGPKYKESWYPNTWILQKSSPAP